MKNRIKCWWRRRVNGFRRLTKKQYLVNLESKEIHRLRRPHVNCHTDQIVRRKYVTEVRAFILIATEGYNGCRFCWKEEDNG